jgi:hypothetical protein
LGTQYPGWPRRLDVRRLLPAVAVITFVAMVAVAESQVRSSPKWPPPPRHELGGWDIEPPKVLYWAASLNLPATIPILWMAGFSDAFSYAFDDHHLIVYVPWVLFVGCLWYVVACRLDHLVARRPLESPARRGFFFGALAFVTVEMIWAASVFKPVGESGRAAIMCFWIWSLLVGLGWVDFILKTPRT